MAAGFLPPKKKQHTERQHSVRLATVSSSASSSLSASRALGKLKREKTTAQDSPSKSTQQRSFSAGVPSPAAGLHASRGPVGGGNKAQRENAKARDIIQQFMQKQFLSKFRPQRAQRLRLRCSGVQQRQQQRLAIPTRKPVVADGGEKSVRKRTKGKKKSARPREKTTASAGVVRQVCSEALAELGI